MIEVNGLVIPLDVESIHAIDVFVVRNLQSVIDLGGQ